jgi:hypothetical protein
MNNENITLRKAELKEILESNHKSILSRLFSLNFPNNEKKNQENIVQKPRIRKLLIKQSTIEDMNTNISFQQPCLNKRYVFEYELSPIPVKNLSWKYKIKV